MLDPEQSRKHDLECLRLEADCMQLAVDAPDPHLQSHFRRMAQVWFTKAVSGPTADAGPEMCVAKTRST
jgi:hypothetical protein